MAIIAILLSIVAYKVISNTNKSTAAKEIEELNKSLPLKVDELTTLNSIALENNSVVYHYTLSLNQKDHPNLKTDLEMKLGFAACNENFKTINDQHPITMKYQDINDTLISAFDFKQGYCH